MISISGGTINIRSAARRHSLNNQIFRAGRGDSFEMLLREVALTYITII